MITFGTTAAVHYKIAQQATLLSQTFQLRPANAASIIQGGPRFPSVHDRRQKGIVCRLRSGTVGPCTEQRHMCDQAAQEKAQPDAYSSAVAGDDGAGDDW